VTYEQHNAFFRQEWGSGVAALAAALDGWEPRTVGDVWAKLSELEGRLTTLLAVVKAVRMPDELRDAMRRSEEEAAAACRATREKYAIPVLWPDLVPPP
jgi:hypothetical protein